MCDAAWLSLLWKSYVSPRLHSHLHVQLSASHTRCAKKNCHNLNNIYGYVYLTFLNEIWYIYQKWYEFSYSVKKIQKNAGFACLRSIISQHHNFAIFTCDKWKYVSLNSQNQLQITQIADSKQEQCSGLARSNQVLKYTTLLINTQLNSDGKFIDTLAQQFNRNSCLRGRVLIRCYAVASGWLGL